MIARIWHGKTKVEDYETYAEFLKERAIPDYKSTKGFIKLIFLRNITEGEGHFTLITFEVMKNFAGENYEKAKYYPEDKNFRPCPLSCVNSSFTPIILIYRPRLSRQLFLISYSLLSL